MIGRWRLGNDVLVLAVLRLGWLFRLVNDNHTDRVLPVVTLIYPQLWINVQGTIEGHPSSGKEKSWLVIVSMSLLDSILSALTISHYSGRDFPLHLTARRFLGGHRGAHLQSS